MSAAGAVAEQSAVRCPVCGSTDAPSLGRPNYHQPPAVAGVPIDLGDLEIHWHCCGACGYQFVHPDIPEERLLKCYREAPGGHWVTERELAQTRLYDAKKRVLEQYSPGKRVLDFGCFDGGFLEYLGPGYEKFGIEPATEAARVAEQRGVKMLGATTRAALAHQVDVGPMDAIVAFDVFEHLTDPVATLRDLRHLLRPGGIIVIETGDTDAAVFRRYGLNYPYASLVEHVGLFNRSSIAEAGRQAGLTLAHFEPSRHHVMPLRKHVTFRLWNAAWHVLRGLDGMKLPLPAQLQKAARGPLPRTIHVDHFLAVLRAE